MKKRRRTVPYRLGCLIAASACCAALVAGCGGESTSTSDTGEANQSPASGRVSGGSPTIAATSGAPHLDPYRAGFFTGTGMVLFPVLWSGLVQYEPDSALELRPALAEEWSVSPDGRTVTFELRDAKFSDGSPLTAKDVVVSLKRAIDPKTVYAVAPFLPKIERVASEGDASVMIRTKEPASQTLLHLLPWIPVLPNGKSGDGSSKPPVTSGPFRVEDFEPDDQVVVVPNDNYWGEPPAAERMTFVRASDQAASVTGMKAGDIAVSLDIPLGEIDQFRSDGYNVIDEKYPSGQNVLMVDDSSPPFDDPRARQALVHATDKQTIMETVHAGVLEPSTKNLPFANNDPYLNSDLPDIPFDLDRAKQLFAEAGIEEGTRLTFWTLAGENDWRLMGQILQADLKKIGIELTIESLDGAEWAGNILPYGKKWPGVITPNGMSLVPSPLVSLFYVSGACVCNFDNAEYTEAVAKAGAETDEEERKRLYHDSQRIFQEQAAAVIVFVGGGPMVTRPEFGGAWADPSGIPHYERFGELAG